jgi:protein-tyrosine-phosphatase
LTYPHSLFVSRRGIVAFGLFLLARPLAATAAPCRKPRVLFVCPAGTVKSAIAREHFKHSATRRGLAVQVQSRGVHLEDHMTPILLAQLRADGVDPRTEPLQALTPADIAQADVVVAFEEAAQAPGMEKARVWDIPSWKSDYAGARAALLPKIDGLLDELATVGRRGCSE